MNVLVEAIIAFLLVVGVGAWSYATGQHNGINSQKVLDQKQFDQINKERSDQKTQAAGMLKKANDDVMALVAERDAFDKKLGDQHAKDTAATDALRAQLVTRSLRFKAPAKSGADRACRPSAPSSAASASLSPGPAFVQLPGAVTSDLRQLTLDADQLKDNYAICYEYIHGPH